MAFLVPEVVATFAAVDDFDTFAVRVEVRDVDVGGRVARVDFHDVPCWLSGFGGGGAVPSKVWSVDTVVEVAFPADIASFTALARSLVVAMRVDSL